jgi:hypothetical protein
MRDDVSRALLQFARKLRFPYLAALTFVVFVIDLIAPDLIPFADELLLGLLTLLFGSLSGAHHTQSTSTRIQTAQSNA